MRSYSSNTKKIPIFQNNLTTKKNSQNNFNIQQDQESLPFDINSLIKNSNDLIHEIQEDQSLQQALLKVVMNSKKKNMDQNKESQASKAISLLNAARFNFSGLDLSEINIPFANLTFAIMQNTNLSKVNLKGVNFGGALITKSTFQLANMENTCFENLYKIQIIKKPIGYQSLKNDSKNLVIYYSTGQVEVQSLGSSNSKSTLFFNHVTRFESSPTFNEQKQLLAFYDIENYGIAFHNLKKFKQEYFIRGKLVKKLQFVNNGTSAILAMYSNQIRIWNYQTGQCQFRIPFNFLQQPFDLQVFVQKDCQQIIIAYRNSIKIFNTKQRTKIRLMKEIRLYHEGGLSIDSGQNEKIFAAVLKKHYLHIFNYHTGQSLRNKQIIEKQNHFAKQLKVFGVLDSKAAVISYDNLKIYCTRTLDEIQRISIPLFNFEDMWLDPYHDRMLMYDKENIVIVQNSVLEKGKYMQESQKMEALDIKFNKSGNEIWAIGPKCLQSFKLNTLECKQQIDLPYCKDGFKIANDGEKFIAIVKDNFIKIFESWNDEQNIEMKLELRSNHMKMSSAMFTQKEDLLLTTGYDQNIRIFNVQKNFKEIALIDQFEILEEKNLSTFYKQKPINAFFYSHDEFIVSNTANSIILIFSVKNFKCVSFKTNDDTSSSLAFLTQQKSKNKIVALYRDYFQSRYNFHFYKGVSFQQLTSFEIQQKVEITAIRVFNESNYMALGFENGVIEIIDYQKKGLSLCKVHIYQTKIVALDISLDDKCLIATADNSPIAQFKINLTQKSEKLQLVNFTQFGISLKNE